MTRRYTEEEWKDLASKVHGNKYDYSACCYKGMAYAVTIRCPTHGEFSQKAQSHILGSGCKECAAESRKSSVKVSSTKRRISTSELVQRFKAVHQDRYSYELVESQGTKKPVTIVCREHGPFPQKPAVHLKGSGCPACGRSHRDIAHRLTQVEFADRVKAIHGDRYNLSKAVYRTQYDKVSIGCRKHGQFLILPFNLWAGGGCPDCAREINGQRKRLTTKEFISRAVMLHGDTYDYSETKYLIATDPVHLICRHHGEFLQLPFNHLAGRGCLKCGRETAGIARKTLFTLEWEEVSRRFAEVHGSKYDYSSVRYLHSQKKVEIRCALHGSFMQTPAQHWIGKGCPDCGREARLRAAREKTLGNDEIIRRFRRLHQDRYDYSQVRYVSYITKVEILCSDHGVFLQTPAAHLEGKGCSKCAQSSGETRVRAWLIENKFEHEIEWRLPIPLQEGGNRYARFDFFLPSEGIFIELDGPHHFAPVRYTGMTEDDAVRVHEATVRRDRIKDLWAQDSGFSVIRIRWDKNIESCLDDALQQLGVNLHQGR